MSNRISPPSTLHTLLEGRAGLELNQLLVSLPLMRMGTPHGQGRVLVLPGFMNDDRITWPLRRFLQSLGYEPYPWDLGISRAPMFDYLPKLLDRAQALSDEGPILLVGYSRGGVLAREMARERPELFKGVVTVGSPIRGGAEATQIGAFAARQTGLPVETLRRLQEERGRIPIPVPIRILYSKTDGIVAWRACIDESNEDVRHTEVKGSHAGLMVNTQVYRVVARELAELAA